MSQPPLPCTLAGRLFPAFVVLSLCSIPLISAIAPRFLAFAPGVIGLGGLVLYRLSRAQWPAFSKSLTLWYCGIVGLCALSTLWAVGGSETLIRALRIGFVLFSGLMVLGLLTSETLRTPVQRLFIQLFPFACMLGMSITLLDLYANGPVYDLFHESDPEPLNLSRLNRSIVSHVFMVFPALWCVRQTFWSPVKQGGILGLLALFTIALLYKTESQSAQLSFIIGAAFFVLFPVRFTPAWTALKSLIITGMLGAPWIAQYMFAVLASGAKHSTWLSRGYASDRMEIWDFIARKALENPFYGFGLEATRDIPHFETQMLYNPLDHVLHPHNFVLQIWIEFGVLGIVTGAGFFVFILQTLQKQKPPFQRLSLGLFMAAFGSAAISYGLWQGWWLGLFILLALYIRILEPSEKPSAPLPS